MQPKFLVTVAWFLLAHFCFFATSHQTTLSQIDWRSAFVGRTTGIGQSNFISGVLVILNTFCGHIFFFCMYGLLTTETFSFFALFPNLIKSNINRDQLKDGSPSTSSSRLLSSLSKECVSFDMTRGELVLYEQEGVFIATVFKVGVQLFILQGIKVRFCGLLFAFVYTHHIPVNTKFFVIYIFLKQYSCKLLQCFRLFRPNSTRLTAIRLV